MSPTRHRLLAFVALIALALRPARVAAQPARTRVGAFVTSLSNVNEAQRQFDITFWTWLISPPSVGAVDPARTLEITNAAAAERQYAVTTDTPAGRYSQVKFRATVRAPLDVRHFPFDRHTLRVHLEDAERDARAVEFVPDVLPNGRRPLGISVDLDPTDWTIGRLALTTRVHREPTTFGDPTQTGDSAYSRVVLEIDIARRHPARILVTLLLGTFMSLLVAFFAVLLPIQQSPPRYTLLSGALFVCITNRLLVDARLPAGSALGLLDQMQFLAIAALLALTAASLWLTNAAEQRIAPARATLLSHRLAFGWVAVVVALEALIVMAHRR